MNDNILFALDQSGPLWHEVLGGGEKVLRGWIFSADDRPIRTLAVRSREMNIASCPIELPSPEIGASLPNHRSAARCRFELRGRFPVGNPVEFEAIYADGESAGSAVFPPSWIGAERERIERLAGRLDALPVPDAERVALTQGIPDVDAYRKSVLTGFLHMHHYLGQAGVQQEGIRSVLDIGCGTGRVLAGWYLDDPTRHLRGYDINPTLVEWAVRSMPRSMSFAVNAMLPPLPEQSESVDLAFMISVFTHLSLDIQRGWVAELHRLLKPGGIFLLTLQGDIYVRLTQPQLQGAFSAQGYAEVATAEVGSNNYGSYHSRPFAESLMRDFRLLRHFPRGGDLADPVFFPLAAFQDVYVFQKT